MNDTLAGYVCELNFFSGAQGFCWRTLAPNTEWTGATATGA
jgi:hypothetical protein